MVRLLTSVESQFDTDFAIINATQESAEWSPGESFATSSPGCISLQAGSKYSRIRIRAERWDGLPPLTDGWEDIDELPFAEVADGGDLMLSGFDPGEVGLDVRGLGRGRVQIRARGRNRYHYGSEIDPDRYGPEDWLLRVYPSPGRADPMAGGPRRLAGEGGLRYAPGTPWREAVRGLRSSGWSSALVGSHGFYLAQLALLNATGPLTRQQLAASMMRWMAPWNVGGDDAESAEVPPRRGNEDDPLASSSGRDSIRTTGDTIDALRALGLLLTETRNGRDLLVANPSPEPAWERLGWDDAHIAVVRQQDLRERDDGVASDIVAATRWAGSDGIRASPRAMAIRWASRIDAVSDAIRILSVGGHVIADRPLGFDSSIDPDEEVVIRSAR